MVSSRNSKNKIKVVISVGTYDGGIAAYEMILSKQQKLPNSSNNNNNTKLHDTNDNDNNNNNHDTNTNQLQLLFASPIHKGSVRSLSVTTVPKISSTKNHHHNSTATNNTTTKTTTTTTTQNNNLVVISTGYDEMIKVHDYYHSIINCGLIQIPPSMVYGTPTCSSFIPPNTHHHSNNNTSTATTHCIIGFDGISSTTSTSISSSKQQQQHHTNTNTGGQLVLYKKRDYSIQHIMSGHDGGIMSLCVHPTGSMVLSSGKVDGKIKLWDLTRGRLAYSTQIIKQHHTTMTNNSNKNKYYPSIHCIVWSTCGNYYGYCYVSHITVKHVTSGIDVLDVELSCQVNQICFIYGIEGIFIAAACNDGSLPVLAIQQYTTELDVTSSSLQNNNNTNSSNDQERRAIMAIEPVDESRLACEERFKCIVSICDYYVATANSLGVVSVMNLQGAITMITTPTPSSSSDTTTTTNGSNNDNDDDNEDTSDDDEEDNDDIDDEEEEEFAVDIIDSVQVGTGSRITCLAVWTSDISTDDDDNDNDNVSGNNHNTTSNTEMTSQKRSNGNDGSSMEGTTNYKKCKHIKQNDRKQSNEIELDPISLQKARNLVSKAKKIQQRKHEKRMKPKINK